MRNRLIRIVKLLKIKSLSILLISSILTSCASAYKTTNLQEVNFSNKMTNDSIELNYNYDFYNQNHNKKTANKAKRKGIKVVSLQITNKTNDTIRYGKDFQLETSQNLISLINPNETKKTLKQNSALYLLGFISAGVSFGTEGTSSYIGLNPWGAVYVIPNMIIAISANKKLDNELNKYDINNLIIPPSKKGYALISFKSDQFVDISIRPLE